MPLEFHPHPAHGFPPMPPMLKEFLQRWIITTVAVLVATHVVRGISYDNWQALLVATLTLGLLNAFLRPLLMLLSLPLLILSLGLFTLVINAALLYFVGELIQGFHVASFGAAFWGGLVTSLVSLALQILTGTGGTRLAVHRGPPPRGPGSGPGPGQGPVIDF
jgi:putative membrane protein